MDTDILVALVGIGGAATGGLISFVTARSMRRMEWKLQLREREILAREAAYGDFLAEANRLMFHAIDDKLSHGAEFTALASLEVRLLFFSERVGTAAKDLAICVISHHSRDPAQPDGDFPKLQEKFILECRADLANLREHA